MREMRKYDKEWLQELCASSYSYAEVLRKAGRKNGGGSVQTLKRKLLSMELMFHILQDRDGMMFREKKAI